ncbi:LysR family transcriptional regulator [Sphingomonas sp. H39-1-10]|uniref:LysR family transcriptional regulator n=1 Tax=Sphingomonas TaxID=13687 RepID=UPI000886105C|nr:MULTISPECIES: LysR family transcriptional regulator [Sphingomonas]MDF0488517.1 LysR family transcriptional regulator [Sphingomonas pollutisoli]SDA11574.1 DNA-binding transcriptional regulator, LysR family [Sphingomonas sp. NFR15]
MVNPGTPTYDQLRTFLAVVDSGSFAGAGRQLGRAVSVISYGIANLEAQLGVRLFDREGTRKPKLTVAGRAVLAEIRTIGEGFDGLRAKVKGLLEGLEAEVNLALDVMLPAARVGSVLRAFNVEFPTVTLRLHVEALGAVTALVLDQNAVVGISGPLAAGVQGVECISAGSVPMVPVAAPDHPLARMERIAPGAGREHIQLVLTDRSPLTEGRDFSVMSPRTWRLADLGAKHSLLREGIGWGNMPLPMIEGDLASGTLVRLEMPDHPGGMYRFAGVWRRDLPPGPAGSWLLRQFVEYGKQDQEFTDLSDI